LSTRDGIDMLKLCFDQLHAEGAKTGRIMNVGLHPHVIGQPHRIATCVNSSNTSKASRRFGGQPASKSQRGI
jgi:hypothetical protein